MEQLKVGCLGTGSGTDTVTSTPAFLYLIGECMHILIIIAIAIAATYKSPHFETCMHVSCPIS